MADRIHIVNLKALKQHIIENLNKEDKSIVSLEIGQYSDIQKALINNIEIEYRLLKSKKGIKVILKNYKSSSQSHKPIFKNNSLFIYDKELNKTLKVSYQDFLNLSKKQISNQSNLYQVVDYNLSNEQKELLCTGQEIALNVTDISKGNNNKVTKSKTYSKVFVADLTFFLGKTQLLIEQCKHKRTLHPRLKIDKEHNY